jgi:hypothetical protein
MSRQWLTQQKSVSHSSSTPAKTGLFQSRPFVEPTSSEDVLPERQGTPELQTQLDRTPSFGHTFSNLPVSTQTTVPVLQRQHATEQTEEQQETEPSLSQRIQAAQSQGESLDPGVQRQVENGIGANLGQVRIHTDGEADALSRAVSAKAFTTGQDIFFRAGAYNPDSIEGLHLIAHEVTHTLQQAAGPVAGHLTEEGVSISDPNDSFEQAAENVAQKVVSGASAVGQFNSAQTVSKPDVTVQRQDENENQPFWNSGIFKGIASGAGFLPGAIGATAKLLRHPFDLARGTQAATEGEALESVVGLGTAASSFASGLAGFGGFSMLGSGGLGGAISAISSGGLGTLGTVGGLGATAGLTMPASAALTGGGLSGAAALGPAAAVAGAGLAGLGAGTWLAENTGIDEAIGDGMYAASKPAYTQTLGWKLAEWFD